jgi:hypothetical protein
MMEAVRTSETLVNIPVYTVLQPGRQPFSDAPYVTKYCVGPVHWLEVVLSSGRDRYESGRLLVKK